MVKPSIVVAPFDLMTRRSESSVPLRRVVKSKGATTIEGLTTGGEYRDDEDEDDS